MIAQDSLIWPLICKPELTSTFGEFRVGHFHAGIDLRTPEGEGMPIIAPRNGSVVRVRETPWGYGKVVYYKMDNGITAVFAHLSVFNDTIEQIIKAEKYREKSNTAEMWFKEGDLPFYAHDTLAFSGSTGAGSPHLHFETRISMDKPINPMDLGYVTEDTLAPQINEIWLIPRSDNATIKGRPIPYRINKTALAGENPKIKAKGLIALAIDIRDRESEENRNTYGAYVVRAIAGLDTLFNFIADTISYSTTKQIGLIYELGHQEEFAYRKPLLRMETPGCSEICMLKSEPLRLIDVTENTIKVRIEAEDYIGNSTARSFTLLPQTDSLTTQILPDSIPDIEVSISHRIFGIECMVIVAELNCPLPTPPVLYRNENAVYSYSLSNSSYSYRLFDMKPGVELILRVGNREFPYIPGIWRFESGMEYELEGGWRIEIPENSVYEPFIADDTILVDSTGAKRLRLDPPGVVLKRPSLLSADISAISADSGKACIVRLWNEDTFFVSNKIDGEGRIVGSISALGTFILAQDSISPNLVMNIGDTVLVSKTLHADIEDDLSGFSREVLPNSYIDNKWIPTQYDPESNTIMVDIEEIETGLHVWRVSARDVCGNVVTDSVRFVKKETSK